MDGIGCILLVIFSLAVAQQVPVIKFLRGVPRLSNAFLADYYFSCNAIGASLQWEVNQDVIGFNGGDPAGSVNTSSSANIRYIATLLSSRLFQGGLYTFDSVLIVSSTPDVNINVACTNAMETVSISSKIITIKQNEIQTVKASTVILQYQFSETVLNGAITTYFYMCEVNDVVQSWLTTAQAFGFTNQDNIGTDRMFLTDDRTVAVQQAILIAKEPPISILLVTGILGVNVSCRSNQFQATLFFSDVLSRTTPAPTTEASATSDITIDISPTNGTTENPDQESTTVIALGTVAGVFLICIVLLVIGICVYFCVICFKQRRKVQDEEENEILIEVNCQAGSLVMNVYVPVQEKGTAKETKVDEIKLPDVREDEIELSKRQSASSSGGKDSTRKATISRSFYNKLKAIAESISKEGRSASSV